MESSSEFAIEIGVDQGIDGRVEVADPEDDAHDVPRCGGVLEEQGAYAVPIYVWTQHTSA